MEQEHIAAIENLVTGYCNTHGLVPTRGFLHVRLIVLDTSLEVEMIDTEGLDLVYDRILRDAFDAWVADTATKTVSSKTIGRMKTLFENGGFMDRPIGCFCLIERKKLKTYKDAGNQLLFAIATFLGWVDARLRIGGCTNPKYVLKK